MEDIIILDNFLPKYIQDFLEKGIYNSSMQFGIGEKTIHDYIKEENGFFDGDMFSTNIKIPSTPNSLVVPKSISHYYLIPLQIAYLSLGKDFNFEEILRAKINVTYNIASDNHIKNKICPPHQDFQFHSSLSSIPNYNIAVYYVNDSDGDTIIYEGSDLSELKVHKTISPQKGRMVMFNGSKFHSSSHPSQNPKRIIINYNILNN